MTLYLAAPYAYRDKARDVAARINDETSFFVISSWLREEHPLSAGALGPASDLDAPVVDAMARQNLLEVQHSQAFVLLTAEFCGVEGGGGRHVETGYALGFTVPTFVVGQPENVFHRMRHITVVRTIDDLISELNR